MNKVLGVSDSFDSLSTWSLNRGTSYSLVDDGIRMIGEGVDVAIRSTNRPVLDLSLYSGGQLKVFIPDVSSVEDIIFYASTNTTFTKHGTYSFKRESLRNGWNELHFDLSQLTFTNGGFNGSDSVNVLQVLAVPTEGKTVDITVGELNMIKSSKGNVIFTMDDNWVSQFTEGYRILDSYGMRGNIAVISNMVGINANRMSEAQLYEVYNKDWDLLVHTHNHPNLSTLTKEQQRQELLTCKQYLHSKRWFRGSNMVVYPYGAYNQDTLDVMDEEGFVLGRSLVKGVEPTPSTHLKEISVLNLVTNLSVEEAKRFVDRAIDTGTTLVLLCHRIGEEDDGQNMWYSALKFEEIVQYVKEKEDSGNVNVLTMSEFYRYYHK